MPVPQAITKNRGLMGRMLVLGIISLVAWCLSVLVVGLGARLGFSRVVILAALVALAVISAAAALLIPGVAGCKKGLHFHLAWLGFMLVALLLTKLLMSLMNGIGPRFHGL